MNREVLLIVFPVFLVIGVGFALRRTGLVQPRFLFELNRLIYYVALPALLFYKIATADFNAKFNGVLLGGMGAAIFLVFVLAFVFGRMRGYPPPVLGAFTQGAFRGNLAYVGLAIVYNAYGEAGFTTAGILLGFLVPQLNFQSVLALTLARDRSALGLGFYSLVQQVVGNPLIIASFIGIGWSYLSLPLHPIFDRALDIITGMSLPLALISIGASFSISKLRGEMRLAILATLIKIVFTPLLAGLLLFVLGIRGEELAIAVLLAGTPTATAAYIMAQQMKADAELTGAIIMLSTLCSMLTYTASLSLLHYLGL